MKGLNCVRKIYGISLVQQLCSFLCGREKRKIVSGVMSPCHKSMKCILSCLSLLINLSLEGIQ